MSDEDDIDYTPPPPKVVERFNARLDDLYIPKESKCFYCDEETNSLAGNPSKWALRLPVDPKEPGRPKTVCTGCVLERLRIAESVKEARRLALAVVRRAEEERIEVARRDAGEPTEEEIRRLMESTGENYYNARERLREAAYGGKPPHGYGSWGDYWKGST